MGTVRMNLAYHGAGFAGWATQPGARTVQGELEGALERMLGVRCHTPVVRTLQEVNDCRRYEVLGCRRIPEISARMPRGRSKRRAE